MGRTSLGCAMPWPQSVVHRDTAAEEKFIVPGSRWALLACTWLSGFKSCRQRRAVRGRDSETPCGRAGVLWRLCSAITRPSTGALACICILINDAVD